MRTEEVGYSMLKLTKKADYGLMALKFLAEHAEAAAQRGNDVVAAPEAAALSAKDIADAYGIPAQLLAKILQQLTKTGLLKSHAGMNGGYALSREARSISAYEVILAIDGPFFITSCTKGAKACDLTPSCTIKEPLARVNETIAGVLKSISIQDLVEHEPAKHAEISQLVSLTL
jgi:Rrf2 family protein